MEWPKSQLLLTASPVTHCDIHQGRPEPSCLRSSFGKSGYTVGCLKSESREPGDRCPQASIRPHTGGLELWCVISTSMWLSETIGTGAESCEISWCPGCIMDSSKVSWWPSYVLGAATGLPSRAQGCTGSGGPPGIFGCYLIKLAKIKINEECANTQ